MKTTIEFLDTLKARRGITSDNQLATFLGCTRSSISHYRNKKNYLDEDIAFKIAEELDLEPSYVLACVAAERSRNPEVKAAWKHAADLLHGLAAALAVVAFLPLVSLPSNDAGIVYASQDCILCQMIDDGIHAAIILQRGHC